MKVLFIGDIVGSGGRCAVNLFAPQLIEEYGCDFCIANGENMAGGNGMQKGCIEDLAQSGVDVFTSGDHAWDQKGFDKEIDSIPNVLRPANFATRQPGRGFGIFESRSGSIVGVINIIGRTFMAQPYNCPFETVDAIIDKMLETTKYVFVDFHAEATSDKIAMGRFLAGRATAVLGTHTHVPTADEQIFQGGTAFQCDVGMVGGRDSVLGRDIEAIISRYTMGLPVKFPVVTDGIRLNGTVVECNEDGRATRIVRVVRDC